LAFLTEDPPAPGTAETLLPGITRIVAPNPGPMTYHGTNTWLVEGSDGLTVIDPGPDHPAHVEATAAAGHGRITLILLTHTHPDHAAAAPALRAATGAPLAAWPHPWARDFHADIPLADGQRIGNLQAVHTPGHASDHLCFARDDGTLFSGDHVMSWNTTIVSPPDGDMAAYMNSLRLLLTRNDTQYCCGHGPILPRPHAMVRALLLHRLGREAAIAAALGPNPVTVEAITAALYTGVDQSLHKAASRTVLAHLLKLETDGAARRGESGLWTAA
jgi:glyoxylase-like metal-dependent hydrolase (beta-lactamase superfamily II)